MKWAGAHKRVGELMNGQQILTKSNDVLTVMAFKIKGEMVTLTTKNHRTGKIRDGDWHMKAKVFVIENDS